MFTVAVLLNVVHFMLGASSIHRPTTTKALVINPYAMSNHTHPHITQKSQPYDTTHTHQQPNINIYTSSNKNYLTPWQIGALNTIDMAPKRKILGWARKQIL